MAILSIQNQKAMKSSRNRTIRDLLINTATNSGDMVVSGKTTITAKKLRAILPSNIGSHIALVIISAICLIPCKGAPSFLLDDNHAMCEAVRDEHPDSELFRARCHVLNLDGTEGRGNYSRIKVDAANCTWIFGASTSGLHTTLGHLYVQDAQSKYRLFFWRPEVMGPIQPKATTAGLTLSYSNPYGIKYEKKYGKNYEKRYEDEYDNEYEEKYGYRVTALFNAVFFNKYLEAFQRFTFSDKGTPRVVKPTLAPMTDIKEIKRWASGYYKKYSIRSIKMPFYNETILVTGSHFSNSDFTTLHAFVKKRQFMNEDSALFSETLCLPYVPSTCKMRYIKGFGFELRKGREVYFSFGGKTEPKKTSIPTGTEAEEDD